MVGQSSHQARGRARTLGCAARIDDRFVQGGPDRPGGQVQQRDQGGWAICPSGFAAGLYHKLCTQEREHATVELPGVWCSEEVRRQLFRLFAIIWCHCCTGEISQKGTRACPFATLAAPWTGASSETGGLGVRAVCKTATASLTSPSCRQGKCWWSASSASPGHLPRRAWNARMGWRHSGT